MNDITAVRADASRSRYSPSEYHNSSMAEYRISIYSKIDDIISQYTDKNDLIMVTMSDSCFVAMKQDPSYEAWVLDKVRQACKSCFDDGSDSWIFLKFGKEKTEYEETSHTFPDKRTEKKLREKEEEERKALRLKRKKQLEKKLFAEKLRKQKTEKMYVQMKSIDHRMQVQAENRAIFFGQEYHMKDRRASLYAAAKRRASAYEASFIYCDRPL